MLDDVDWHACEFEPHVFIPDHRGIQIEFLMSIVKNLVPGVDMTLLMRSLMVSRLAVGVPVSNG
jgi:hypothetical protein